MGTKTKLTFAEYAALDPAIAALEKLTQRAAPAAGGDPDYMVFYREVKPLVTALVGWHRADSNTRLSHSATADFALRTEEAYDVVYQHLVDVIGGDSAGS